MHRIKKFFRPRRISLGLIIPVLVFLILFAPIISFAAPLVPCGTTSNPKPCTFNDALTLVNNIIIFIFEFLAIPIAAIMMVYAGFLLITAGGESAGAKTKAKNIFTNAVVGLAISAAAVLIVKAILGFMGYVGPMYL